MDDRLRERQRAAGSGDLVAQLAEVRATVRSGRPLPGDVMLAARLGHPELIASTNKSMWEPEVASVVRAGRHAVRIWATAGSVTPAEPTATLCGIRLNPRELGGQAGGWPTCEGCIRHARAEVYSQVALWGWVSERGYYLQHLPNDAVGRLWRATARIMWEESTWRESAETNAWLHHSAGIRLASVSLQRLPDGPLIVEGLEDLDEGLKTYDHLPERLVGQIALYGLAFSSMYPSDMDRAWAKRAPEVAKTIWPGS